MTFNHRETRRAIGLRRVERATQTVDIAEQRRLASGRRSELVSLIFDDTEPSLSVQL